MTKTAKAQIDDATRQAIESAFSAAQQQAIGGNLVGAEPIFRKIIEMDPAHAGALYHLAVLLMEQRRFKDALPFLKKALPAFSSSAQAQVNMGITLYHCGQIEPAKTHLQKALKLKPGMIRALDTLGIIENAQNNYAAAEKYFQSAIAGNSENPEAAHAFYNYAILLERLSRLDEALPLAEKALSFAPELSHVRFIVAKIMNRKKRYDAALSILEQGDPKNDYMAAPYYAEMGQLYDRLDQPNKAFAAFQAANDILRKTIRDETLRLVPERIAAYNRVVTPEWYKSWTSAPEVSSSDSPVFLIGFARSGTTLLDQILTAQGDFSVSEERPALNGLRDKIQEKHNDFPACLAFMPTDEIVILRKKYLSDLKKMGALQEGKRLIDKMPMNTNQLPLIHRLYPQAKIIFALRHPCDVVLSCFMQQFTLNPAMIHFLDLKSAASLYDRTMSLWEQCKATFSLDCHIVWYENVVDNFKEEVEGLLNFLEAPWHDSILEFDRVARDRDGIKTPSYTQVTQKIYSSASGRWRKYKQHLEPVMGILAPWIKKFGYEA